MELGHQKVGKGEQEGARGSAGGGGAGRGWGERWEGQVAWSWAEAIKVPFFSVSEGQAPNTQPLGQARSRVSP